MARLSIPAKAALATAAYFALSVAVLASFNLGLAPPLERLLSLLAAPALFLMAIWTPLLRPLGLASGDWLAAPTLPGALLLIALYAALAYLAATAALRLMRRKV
ncbi:hypothetical protein LJR289_002180 [Pseudoduganella sp. LjRoot289]|uniref:hypothetical protein n=1 Tax=Pseudoduganella sp. LjRoot289 TaxID=3342314 RepID=UPI003ECF4316